MEVSKTTSGPLVRNVRVGSNPEQLVQSITSPLYPPKADVRRANGMSDMGQKRSYGKSSNTMARRKSLAAGVTVQIFAFVYLSLPCDVLVRDLIK